MFNATNFIYDGVDSAVYGLKIATINGSVVEETSYVTPTITTTKPALGKRFLFLDSQYDELPTVEFSVFGESALSDGQQRDILRWIDNRRGFKELVINQPGLQEYVYRCIFNVTSIIYHAGSCVGFNLKATFDSPYHYKKSRPITVEGTGTEKEISVFNDSDIIDDYIYPVITFKPTNYFVDGTQNECSVYVINTSDDASRKFEFVGTPLNTKITVDNESKVISGASDMLSKFNGMKWLRLKKGKNVLKVKMYGELTITFNQYIKIRF